MSDTPLASHATPPSAGGVSAPGTSSSSAPAEDSSLKLQRALDLLAQRERELGRKESEWKQREREYNELLERKKHWETFDSRLSEDPLSVLEEKGLTLDALQEKALKAPIDPAVRELRDEIKALKSKLGERETQEQRQKEEQGNKAFLERIDNHVQGKEEYELINLYGARDLVFQVVAQHWEKSLAESGEGELLDLDKACAAVEKHLETELEKALNAKKIRSRISPPSEPTKPPVPARSEPATIGNGMRALTETSSGESRLSDKERFERAIAQLKARAR